MISEGFGRVSGMLPEEPDKIGNVFVAQMIGYLIYLIGRRQEVSFRFLNDVFIDEVGTGLAQGCLCDRIQLIRRETHHFGILRYPFTLGNMHFQEFQKFLKPLLYVRIYLG